MGDLASLKASIAQKKEALKDVEDLGSVYASNKVQPVDKEEFGHGRNDVWVVVIGRNLRACV